jgi:hypothetical protein
MFLTPKEKNLLTQLLFEYTSEGYFDIMSLNRFLESKYENSGYLTTYYNVWQFAQNDY